MTDSQLQILVSAIPSTIAAIFAGMALLKSRENGRKADVIQEKTDIGNAKIDVLHEATNGKMEQLLKATGAAEHAAGKEQEREEERDRQACITP